MIRHIQPHAIPKSEAPFSQVVLDDNFAYISGLVAADFPEGRAELGEVGNETTAVLSAINRILEEIDLDMGQIVRVDVHLASLDEFDAMDAVYREFSKLTIIQREPPRSRVGFLAVAASKLLAW